MSDKNEIQGGELEECPICRGMYDPKSLAEAEVGLVAPEPDGEEQRAVASFNKQYVAFLRVCLYFAERGAALYLPYVRPGVAGTYNTLMVKHEGRMRSFAIRTGSIDANQKLNFYRGDITDTGLTEYAVYVPQEERVRFFPIAGRKLNWGGNIDVFVEE